MVLSVVAAEEILFTAFGDYGRSCDTLDEVVDTLNDQSKARFSVLLGDMAYPDGFQYNGDRYFRIFERFSSSADKFYAVLGNHDYRGSIDAIRAYASEHAKFVFPTSGKAAYHSKTVSLPNGYTLCMLFIDTMHLEPPHLAWMHDELKKCPGDTTFRFVFGHYPMYSVGIYADSSSTRRTRDLLEPIFNRYGVHAYVCGHEHQMQSFVKKGRHYIISGAVAELNRNGEIREDVHKDILKYAYNGGPAFANFRYIDDGKLEYTFRDASDGGRVLHRASVSVKDVRGEEGIEAAPKKLKGAQGCTSPAPGTVEPSKAPKKAIKTTGKPDEDSRSVVEPCDDDWDWDEIDPKLVANDIDNSNDDGSKAVHVLEISTFIAAIIAACIVSI